MTAVPVDGPLSLGRVISERQLVAGLRMPWCQDADGWQVSWEGTGKDVSARDRGKARIALWRPIVRGASLSRSYSVPNAPDGGLVEAEIHESGLMESKVLWPSRTLDPLMLLREFSMFVAWVRHVMAYRHAAGVEYALEVELQVEGDVQLGSSILGPSYDEGAVVEGCFPEPRYVLGPEITLSELVSDFVQDWFDHLGVAFDGSSLELMHGGQRM